MKREKVFGWVLGMGAVAAAVYGGWLYRPVSEEERAAIELDVYEAIVHDAFDPIADMERFSRKLALAVENGPPPAELLARLAPQYQAISATDQTAEPMMTFNLRKFRLPHRRSAVVEVKDSLQGFGFNVTEYRVAIVDGKWRVRSKRLTICGSG